MIVVENHSFKHSMDMLRHHVANMAIDHQEALRGENLSGLLPHRTLN
jgi:hypothetical protein